VVNLEPSDVQAEDWIEHVHGDACDLPSEARRPYDLVFSNSVIEHVGGFRYRRAFADTVRDQAPRHWVQTPYRYFPVEPHWLFPGMQFLPVRARAAIAERWPLAHSRARHEDATRVVLSTELLSKTEMRELFPESTLRFETVLGAPKSLIAYRS
jgi:hypothetical protein